MGCIFWYTISMEKQTIIFDVDGTIADVEHRRHHVTQQPTDWKAFKEQLDLTLLYSGFVTLQKDILKMDMMLHSSLQETNHKEVLLKLRLMSGLVRVTRIVP